MADKWADLFADVDSTPKVDAGPEARRAARGGFPMPRSTDPDLVLDVPGQAPRQGGPANEPKFGLVNVIGGGAPYERGRLPLPPPNMTTAPSGIPDPTRYRVGQGTRAATELESDPLAQMITASAMGMAAGGPAGSLTRFVGGDIAGTAAAPFASAATEGAVSSKAIGGDATTGIAFAGLFRLKDALKGIGQAYHNVGARRDTGILRDLGQHGTEAQQSALEQVGATAVGELSRRYGVAGAADVRTMAANARNGVQTVGSDIGTIYNTVGMQGARPLGSVMTTMNRIQEKLRGTRSGAAVADAIHDEMTKLYEVHGAKPDALIPLGVLRQELTDSQFVGFSGKKFGKLPETMKAIVQREVADGLRTELDMGLTTVAKDPRYASMIERLDKLNGDYHALKYIEQVAERMAAKAPFRPDATLRQRLSLKGPPPGVGEIKPPTGRSLGPSVPVKPGQAPTPLGAGVASAMARGDRDAAAVAMANELFGRPVMGLSPVAPKPMVPGVGAVREMPTPATPPIDMPVSPFPAGAQ